MLISLSLPMALQRGQQGWLRAGCHDDIDIASTPFLSQDIVQIDQQRDHPAVPAALIQSIDQDGGSPAAGRSQAAA